VCSGKYPNRNGGGWKFSRASRRQILKKLICRFPKLPKNQMKDIGSNFILPKAEFFSSQD